MQAGEDFLVRLKQAAVPDADCRDAWIRGYVVRHQAAARHSHRSHVRRVYFLIKPAGTIRGFAGEPIDSGSQGSAVLAISLAFGAMIAGVVWTIAATDRGLQDRIAGTWVVPR